MFSAGASQQHGAAAGSQADCHRGSTLAGVNEVSLSYVQYTSTSNEEALKTRLERRN